MFAGEFGGKKKNQIQQGETSLGNFCRTGEIDRAICAGYDIPWIRPMPAFLVRHKLSSGHENSRKTKPSKIALNARCTCHQKTHLRLHAECRSADRCNLGWDG